MKKYKLGNAMMPMIIGLVAIVAIAGGAYYFLNMSSNDDAMMMEDDKMEADDSMMDDDATHSGDAMMEDDKMMDDDSMMMEDGDVVEVTLEGGMFYFEPTVIEAKVGQTVRVTLDSVEGLHDFVIDEFDAATKQINAGESDTVEFVVDEAGEFEFYCSVGNHRAQGMVGTLVVTE